MGRDYAFFLWKDMVEMYDRNDGNSERRKSSRLKKKQQKKKEKVIG